MKPADFYSVLSAAETDAVADVRSAELLLKITNVRNKQAELDHLVRRIFMVGRRHTGRFKDRYFDAAERYAKRAEMLERAANRASQLFADMLFERKTR